MTTTKRSSQEAKRVIGGQMLENGCDVDEVVNALNVSVQTVYNWKNKIRNDGVDGLLRKNGSGRHCTTNRNNSSKLFATEPSPTVSIMNNGQANEFVLLFLNDFMSSIIPIMFAS